MSKVKKEIKKKKKVEFSEVVMYISFVAFFLVSIYTFITFNTENTKLTVDPVERISEGWEISETENADSTHTLYFKNTLPHTVDDHSALAFKSTDEFLKVYVGGKLIYTYGEVNNFQNPINLGSHYALIKLPADSDGKTIEIYATYRGKQTDWRQEREFFLEGNDGIILKLIRNDLWSALICFVMYAIVLFELFKCVFLAWRHQAVKSTLYLALFILASANWLFSDTVVMQLLFSNAYVKYIVTYYSFLSLPSTFLMFAKERLGKYNRILSFTGALTWLYANVSLLIFVYFSIGFEKHLYVAHGLMGSVVLLIFICCILNRKDKQLKNLLVGTSFLAFFAAISLIAYHHGYTDGLFSAYHFRDFFFAGMISFIIILLYDNYQQTAKDKEDAALSGFYRKSAYTDLLTSLGSRTAFTEDFKSVEEEIADYKNVTVIMLDLNNLKQINDVKGHAVGDELIKSLASCLTSTFGHIGLIYRIGGDEFVVLLKDILDSNIERYLDILRNNISSQSNPELSVDTVAIGYAYRDENTNSDLSLTELLKIADERMYADKKEKKSSFSRVNN